ncbi:hypothetical protein CC78DRAFT_102 [Lojkania enalia]|uniref:Uncharacterized protein n=1 Tax=Lojkania enalia TaxID=147567 RepID=A0A9P4NCU2_9PLEO|nr:hypothetical protein CC78DRAFT_102 [Didymosphaeria enalia]
MRFASVNAARSRKPLLRSHRRYPANFTLPKRPPGHLPGVLATLAAIVALTSRRQGLGCGWSALLGCGVDENLPQLSASIIPPARILSPFNLKPHRPLPDIWGAVPMSWQAPIRSASPKFIAGLLLLTFPLHTIPFRFIFSHCHRFCCNH